MIHTRTTKHKNCVEEHEHSVQIKKRSGRNQKKRKKFIQEFKWSNEKGSHGKNRKTSTHTIAGTRAVSAMVAAAATANLCFSDKTKDNHVRTHI